MKLRSWYSLPQEDRQRAMDEHMRVGHEFRTILNHTTYSFGIDDQEFMTAFECDEPADFMHLMLTLRESEASRYTERDTPIFVGQHVPIRAALDALDGAPAARRGLAVRVLVAPGAPHGEAGDAERSSRNASASRPAGRSRKKAPIATTISSAPP